VEEEGERGEGGGGGRRSNFVMKGRREEGEGHVMNGLDFLRVDLARARGRTDAGVAGKAGGAGYRST